MNDASETRIAFDPPLALGRLVVDAVVLEDARVRIQWRLPAGSNELREAVHTAKDVFSGIRLHDEAGARFRYQGTYGGSRRGETVFTPGLSSRTVRLHLTVEGQTALLELGGGE